MKIALVDDHQILLDGLSLLVSTLENVEVVIKAFSGEALLKNNHLNTIDILVMDINMQGLDGIEVLRLLKKKQFRGNCIFLSSYDDLKLVNEAIQLGAMGYVTKASATTYLHEAIQTVSKGQVYYSPDIKDRILSAFSKSETQNINSQEKGILRQLTEREVEVLKLIALQYTSEEIAKKLYIAKSTVDTHRKNLIYKLKVKNAVGLGLYAERHGLI